MANAYVNFYGDLDPGGYERGAQAFQGVASQAHRADAAVGTEVTPTAIVLTPQSPSYVGVSDETVYCEIKATSGSIFACIMNGDADQTSRAAGKVRIDEGEKICLAKNRLANAAKLYLWAVT